MVQLPVPRVPRRRGRLLAVAALAVLTLPSPGAVAQSRPGADDAHTRAALHRMVLIPAGEFAMGTDTTKENRVPAAYGLQRPAYENEAPQRTVFVDAFYLDRFEVTRIEYRQFLQAVGELDARRDEELKRWAMYAAVGVSWAEADRYCRWKGLRLPREEEWEKAARGADGRRFPWGNDYAEERANMQQGGLAPIGSFPGDVSPYGVVDMAGGVSEWTASWYTPYPGNTAEDADYGEKLRVVRGGSWGGVGHYNLPYFGRTAYRGASDPTERAENVGFRCAISGRDVQKP